MKKVILGTVLVCVINLPCWSAVTHQEVKAFQKEDRTVRLAALVQKNPYDIKAIEGLIAQGVEANEKKYGVLCNFLDSTFSERVKATSGSHCFFPLRTLWVLLEAGFDSSLRFSGKDGDHLSMDERVRSELGAQISLLIYQWKACKKKRHAQEEKLLQLSQQVTDEDRLKASRPRTFPLKNDCGTQTDATEERGTQTELELCMKKVVII